MSNRNTNAHFALSPQVSVERSTFDRSFNVKTTFNVGDLIPFFCDEVLPGDTFEIDTSKVCRLQTLITPVMDNLYLDTYYFFVPNRLVWEHWQEFCGENTQSAWYPSVEYTVPQLIIKPSEPIEACSIADYFGLPVGQVADEYGVNALPFRAYALICDEWFRDQNLMKPVYVPKGDASINYGNNRDNYWDVAYGNKPFTACKFHDYFTSCLPAPQKGPDVNVLAGIAPVYPTNKYISGYGVDISNVRPLSFSGYSQTLTANGELGVNYISNGIGNLAKAAQGTFTPAATMYTNNLFADLDLAQGTTVNEIRQAFAVQRMLEKDARGGTRYIELLKSHFGVESPDARLQRPEYLGGSRMPFNIQQVTQTSSTDETSPIGTNAGWSLTSETSTDVRKSFTEHGYIIGLMCARYDHTYQNGIERFWSRKGRYDYYWPALAHLGEQAVLNKELFAFGYDDDVFMNGVFGYQEAWAEYRYKPNYVTGLMRSNTDKSLDIWHFADDYFVEGEPFMPILSEDWIVEDKANVDRTLAVSSSVSNQIIADVLVQNKCTRPMPLYSVPGLVDHF